MGFSWYLELICGFFMVFRADLMGIFLNHPMFSHLFLEYTVQFMGIFLWEYVMDGSGIKCLVIGKC